MKKNYEKPLVEKLIFDHADIVASSVSDKTPTHTDIDLCKRHPSGRGFYPGNGQGQKCDKDS